MEHTKTLVQLVDCYVYLYVFTLLNARILVLCVFTLLNARILPLSN